MRTKALLSAYLAALRKGGVSATECSDEDAHEQLGLLQLVLFFVSYVVAKHELWAGQGNTTRDGSAWSLRVTGQYLSVSSLILVYVSARARAHVLPCLIAAATVFGVNVLRYVRRGCCRPDWDRCQSEAGSSGIEPAC